MAKEGDKRIGNQFWMQRTKVGRDRLFTEPKALEEAACEYFQWCIDNPFMEVEQSRAPAKPIKDKEGNTYLPPALVELPRMRPFTFQGLCIFLGGNTQWFNQFEKSLVDKTDEISKDFSLICSFIREVIYNQKFSGAASGFFNANIISRDLGLSDKQEHVGKGDTDLFKEKSDEDLLSMLKEISSKLDG